MPTLGEVRVLHIAWRNDMYQHRGMQTYQAALNLNVRLRRRFDEIFDRMKGKKGRPLPDGAELDDRSAILYERIKKDWNAVQPRI